ncbi:MAG TPA: glycoside hydrolase family 5 protein [Nevskiaceae bacterium]|nr:glycoside hydrolase family 5 protein [Nevskiaceae bacterium]
MIRSAAIVMLALALAVPAHGAGYMVQGNQILDPNGHALQLRGISHFGFNDTILVPEYLWNMSWKAQIAQIKHLGFNAVRVPYAPETLYNTTPVDQLSFINPELNPDIIGKTSLQVLDLWMAEADRQGLYIVLDFHSVTTQRLYPQWFVDDPDDYGLTYDGGPYTQADWIRDLSFVAQRYASNPHFMGIDLYNEPHGKVRWSAGDPNQTDAKYYWKPAAEAAATAVLQANPNLLIFVEGINGNFDDVEDADPEMDFGEDLQPQGYEPLQIPSSKLVLSPHSYGPDVYPKDSFNAPSFPANLADDWETLFGQFADQHPVVVGEWGGKYGQGTSGQKDVEWQNAFVDYLRSRGMTSTFYWAYTPNSGDAGGILDDDLNVREDKMAMLNVLWHGGTLPTDPEPAKVERGGGSLDLLLLVLFAAALRARRLVPRPGSRG